MDAHSEPDSRVTQPWNKGKLTERAASSPKTCLGGENPAPIIETFQGSRAV